MSRNRFAYLVLLVCLIGATAFSYFVVPPLLNHTPESSVTVCKNGPYNAKTSFIGNDELGKPLYNLTYDKNGIQEIGLFYSFTSNAVAWIEKETASDSTFLNWWDYGKEIIGCAGRNAVISSPSSQFISLGFTKNTSERDSNQSLIDVATALFTTNSSLTNSIISRYGVNFLFISTEDGGEKAPYILQLLGLNPSQYMSPSGKVFNPKDWTTLGQQTVIYRLLSDQSVTGLNKAYRDSFVWIFAVS